MVQLVREIKHALIVRSLQTSALYKTVQDDKTYGIAHFKIDSMICYFKNV